MILDRQNMFSVDQAITSVGDVDSTGVIDLGTVEHLTKMMHEKIKLFTVRIWVTEAFASTGAGTLMVKLQSSDDNSSFADERTTTAIAKAKLVKDYEIAHWQLPVDFLKRYLKVRYTVATAAFTAGKVRAGLLYEHQTNKIIK